MLLKIYEFIQALQDKIGNDAKVRLSVQDDNLEIHVDWESEDFHARIRFTEKQLSEDESALTYLVELCKYKFSNRGKENPMCTDPIDGLTEIGCPTGVRLVDFTVSNSQYPEAIIATVAVLFVAVVCVLFIVRRKKMAG